MGYNSRYGLTDRAAEALAASPDDLAELYRIPEADYLREQDAAIWTLLHGNPDTLTGARRMIALGYVEMLAEKLGLCLELAEGM